ncbi:hypothetical protein H5410_057515 [Solanum commersonii]|uniref:Uncharacterized protein n=1 Tax=Solanum commersonii TaxID=4109 RepID=A0A9J5WPY5_SOLCO|nr:hypothetical protein H5410_057515 [Solanum commersonii]
MALIEHCYMRMLIKSIHGLLRFVLMYLIGKFQIGFANGGLYMVPRIITYFFEGMSLMYFFIEFSISWIMKWSIEVNSTFEGFPCLQRTFYTKF